MTLRWEKRACGGNRRGHYFVAYPGGGTGLARRFEVVRATGAREWYAWIVFPMQSTKIGAAKTAVEARALAEGFHAATAKDQPREEHPGDYVCAVCGSDKVQHAMWVELNTDVIGEPFGTWCWGDNSYCTVCSESEDGDGDGHTNIVTRDEYEKAQRAKKRKARKAASQ